MQITRHRSGLLLAEQASDERALERELQRYDPRLFLTKELDRRHGRFVYRVLCEYASETPPIPICEWRDERGVPLPLSSSLVEQVKSQRPREGVDLHASERANAERAEKLDADSREAFEEVALDVIPRMRETRSALLPRSRSLQRSRDKRRAKDESV